MSSKLFDLSGKVALITGGNSGIGLGYARGIAKQGGDVCVWGRSDETLQAALQELQQFGTRTHGMVVDVADENAVTTSFANVLQEFGRVDACFANAGVGGEIAVANLEGHRQRIEDPFGGIHHIYANVDAMSGLVGGVYADGAVFVFDLLDYDDSDLTIVETDRKRIDVMQYDIEKFSETGGWGFDTFVGDSKTERLDQDVVEACFGCHASVEDSSYVFSQYRP